MSHTKFLSLSLAATLVALNAQASRSIVYPHTSSDFYITSANISHDINLKDIQGNAIVLTTDSKLVAPGATGDSSLQISKVEVNADTKNNTAWVGIKSQDNKHEVRFTVPVSGMSVDGDNGALNNVTTSTAAASATGQGVSAELQLQSTSAPQHQHSEGWASGCTYVVQRIVCDRELAAPAPRPPEQGPVAAGHQPDPGHPGEQPQPGHQPDPGHGQNPPPPPPKQPVCHEQAVDVPGFSYQVTDGDTWFDTLSINVDDAAMIRFQQDHSTVHTTSTTECLPHIPGTL